MTTTTTTKRCCKIIDRETDAAPGLLRISVDGVASVYFFRVEGDRVRLRKFKAEETYDICRKSWRCTCKGFSYRRTCRHVNALIALTDAGKI